MDVQPGDRVVWYPRTRKQLMMLRDHPSGSWMVLRWHAGSWLVSLGGGFPCTWVEPERIRRLDDYEADGIAVLPSGRDP